MVNFVHNCQAAYTAADESILIDRTISIGKELDDSWSKEIKDGFDESSDGDFCVRPQDGIFIRTHWGQTYDALANKPDASEQVRPIEAFYTKQGLEYQLQYWAHCNE